MDHGNKDPIAKIDLFKSHLKTKIFKINMDEKNTHQNLKKFILLLIFF